MVRFWWIIIWIEALFHCIAEDFGTLEMKSMHARSMLWSLLLAFLDCFSFPYRLASRVSQEKESKDWINSDEFARSTGLLSNRVTKLEEEFNILSSTCSLAAKPLPLDPSAERIKCLEAELAKSKEVRLGHVNHTSNYTIYYSLTISFMT